MNRIFLLDALFKDHIPVTHGHPWWQIYKTHKNKQKPNQIIKQTKIFSPLLTPHFKYAVLPAKNALLSFSLDLEGVINKWSCSLWHHRGVFSSEKWRQRKKAQGGVCSWSPLGGSIAQHNLETCRLADDRTMFIMIATSYRKTVVQKFNRGSAPSFCVKLLNSA